MRKDTHLKSQRPLIFLDEGKHPVESAQPYAWINLKVGTYMGGTVQYTFLQGASRPLMYVFRSERLFGSSDLSQDFFQIPLGRLAAI